MKQIDEGTDGPLPGAVVTRAEPLTRQSFSEIYHTHSPAVFNTVRHTCGEDLAADVMQETFVRLWQRPDRYDPTRGTMRTFLLTMAHNVAVDMLRSHSARRRREELDNHVVHPGDEVDGHLLQVEASDRVVNALHKLNILQRQAIVAVCYGECSYREAARVLGVPEGTIKSRIRVGLQHLRQLLAEPSGDPPTGALA